MMLTGSEYADNQGKPVWVRSERWISQQKAKYIPKCTSLSNPKTATGGSRLEGIAELKKIVAAHATGGR
jgi:hypothetical protein